MYTDENTKLIITRKLINIQMGCKGQIIPFFKIQFMKMNTKKEQIIFIITLKWSIEYPYSAPPQQN